MQEVVIVAARRTAIGNFSGSLAKVSAPDLGAVVVRAMLEETGIEGKDVSEVIMGQVLTAGVGQGPARQTMIKAGLPVSVPAMTINQMCGSGLKTVNLGAQAIANGDVINKCVPGGEPTIKRIADLMGVEVPSSDEIERPIKRVAFIHEDLCIGCTKCIITTIAFSQYTYRVCRGCKTCVNATIFSWFVD